MRQWTRCWQLRRVLVPRHVILYKNLNLLLEGRICPNVLATNFFFHNLTCGKQKDFTNLKPHTQQKKCVAYGTLIFQSFHIFSKSNYETKNLLPKHQGIYTPSIAGSSFCTNLTCFGTGTLQSFQNLDHCPIRNKFFIYR